MKPIKKILLPVDLLMPNEQIAAWAVTAAKAYGADITVLYASPYMDEFAYYFATPVAASRDTLNEAKRAMDAFLSEAFIDPTVKVEGKIFEGHAADVITAYAAENDVDLIIMATQQRSGLEKVFLGSVTNRVLRETPVPVITLRPKD